MWRNSPFFCGFLSPPSYISMADTDFSCLNFSYKLLKLVGLFVCLFVFSGGWGLRCGLGYFSQHNHAFRSVFGAVRMRWSPGGSSVSGAEVFLLDKSVEVFDLVAGGGRSEPGLWGAGLCTSEVAAASCSPGTLLKWYCWLFSECIWRNARTKQQTDEEKPAYNSSIFLVSDCHFCNIHLRANALAPSLPLRVRLRYPSPFRPRGLGCWSLQAAEAA